MLHSLEKKLQPIIATLAFFFGLLISGLLKGAMDQEGVPLSMQGFVAVAFIFLQLFMFLTWLSFICKWRNILFLSLPSTVAILAIIVLYEGIWREEGLQAERRSARQTEQNQLARNSSQSWICKDGWKLNETVLEDGTSYYLSQTKASASPVLIAKAKPGLPLETLGQASALPLDALKNILKSCKGEGFDNLRQAYFPQMRPVETTAP